MDVEIKLYEPVDGTKEYEGKLESFDKENIVININDTKKTFSRKQIANIRLTLDF